MNFDFGLTLNVTLSMATTLLSAKLYNVRRTESHFIPTNQFTTGDFKNLSSQLDAVLDNEAYKTPDGTTLFSLDAFTIVRPSGHFTPKDGEWIKAYKFSKPALNLTVEQQTPKHWYKVAKKVEDQKEPVA